MWHAEYIGALVTVTARYLQLAGDVHVINIERVTHRAGADGIFQGSAKIPSQAGLGLAFYHILLHS